MTKYKQNFEKCVSKIQKTQDAYKFRRKITEIMLSINSRVRLWKISHSGPGCSFYEFYEWYVFHKTLVYIINGINIAWPDKSRAKEIEGKKEKKNIKYMYAK